MGASGEGRVAGLALASLAPQPSATLRPTQHPSCSPRAHLRRQAVAKDGLDKQPHSADVDPAAEGLGIRGDAPLEVVVRGGVAGRGGEGRAWGRQGRGRCAARSIRVRPCAAWPPAPPVPSRPSTPSTTPTHPHTHTHQPAHPPAPAPPAWPLRPAAAAPPPRCCRRPRRSPGAQPPSPAPSTHAGDGGGGTARGCDGGVCAAGAPCLSRPAHVRTWKPRVRAAVLNESTTRRKSTTLNTQ